MFMIINRHNEILARDGEFYPLAALAAIATWNTREEAETHALTIRDYIKIVPAQTIPNS